jgi:hypothetical protein
MIINFDHIEITQAIVDYTKKRGIGLEKSTIEVVMTAGRGSNGYTAAVTVVEEGVQSMESVAVNVAEVTTEAPEVPETEETAEVVEDEAPLDDGKSLFES